MKFFSVFTSLAVVLLGSVSAQADGIAAVAFVAPPFDSQVTAGVPFNITLRLFSQLSPRFDFETPLLIKIFFLFLFRSAHGFWNCSFVYWCTTRWRSFQRRTWRTVGNRPNTSLRTRSRRASSQYPYYRPESRVYEYHCRCFLCRRGAYYSVYSDCGTKIFRNDIN